MPRWSLHDDTVSARQARQARILGAPGINGLSRLGGVSRGGAALASAPAISLIGGLSSVESLTLTADAQTIVSGGDSIVWDTEQLGTLEVRLGFGGYGPAPTSEVVVAKTGRLAVDLSLMWDTYADGGTLELSVVRDGDTHTRTWPGLTTSGQQFAGITHLNVQAGDVLSVTIDQGSGSDQTLASAELVLTLWPTVGTGTFGYRELVLADGPIAYWRLGESSGTAAADETGNGHTGTYSGSPGLAAAGLLVNDPDTCVGFDGSNDYVSVPDSADFDVAAVTLEVWFDTDYSGSGRSGSTFMVYHGQVSGASPFPYNWGIQETSNGSVGITINFGAHSLSIAKAALDGTRNHLVGTYDGTTLRLYHQGVLVDSSTPAVALDQGAGAINLGRWWNGPIYFDGRLDEIAVYGRALSAAEIQEHYNVGTGA